MTELHIERQPEYQQYLVSLSPGEGKAALKMEAPVNWRTAADDWRASRVVIAALVEEILRLRGESQCK